MTEAEQIQALTNEVAALRARCDEADELVATLRNRTVRLNHEIRIRDAMLSEREQILASLTPNDEGSTK